MSDQSSLRIDAETTLSPRTAVDEADCCDHVPKRTEVQMNLPTGVIFFSTDLEVSQEDRDILAGRGLGRNTDCSQMRKKTEE